MQQPLEDTPEDTRDRRTLRSARRYSRSSYLLDEEEYNTRLAPFWPKYQHLFCNKGLQLDTVRIVKQDTLTRELGAQGRWLPENDTNLRHDPSLPDRLFKGTRKLDQKRFIAKAVQVRSWEMEVISTLWSLSLRNEPMNHIVPVAILDLITHPEDNCAFIVMEKWSPHVATTLCCLQQFVSAMQQCIEHITFMHKHRMAHLDISLHNLVTDGNGGYACIDYEQSRRFQSSCQQLSIENYRATEVPPEFETQQFVDPFKVDVWALGVLILRVSKLTGHWIPILMDIVMPMVDDKPANRPEASSVLQAFNVLRARLGDQLGPKCSQLNH